MVQRLGSIALRMLMVLPSAGNVVVSMLPQVASTVQLWQQQESVSRGVFACEELPQ